MPRQVKVMQGRPPPRRPDVNKGDHDGDFPSSPGADAFGRLERGRSLAHRTPRPGARAAMNRLPIAFSRLPESMARLSYFHGWPGEALDRLASGAKIITLAKNDWVSRKGEPLQYLYVVMNGLIRLYLPLSNNMERVVSLVDKGNSFGEACLVLQEPCPYNAVAGKDSHLLAIDSMVFRRELGRHIDLSRQTMERISRHYMDTLRDTEICAQRSSVQRVASYLMLHQPTPDEDTFKISLPARKQDVAAKLGLTQETFSRVLSFLDKQGLIQVMGRQIHVENGRQLAQITSMRDCKEVEREMAP
jgi:CRP-like cAMP-binding protein